MLRLPIPKRKLVLERESEFKRQLQRILFSLQTITNLKTMKKSEMWNLLTQLREREFTLKECYELFSAIDWFIECRNDWMEAIGEKSMAFEEGYFQEAKAQLEKTLYNFGLDYTIDQFITED